MKGFGLAAPGVASRSTLPGPSQKGHEELAHSGSRTHLHSADRLGVTRVERHAFDKTRLCHWLRDCGAAIDVRVSIPKAARAASPSTWREYAHPRAVGCRRRKSLGWQPGLASRRTGWAEAIEADTLAPAREG